VTRGFWRRGIAAAPGICLLITAGGCSRGPEQQATSAAAATRVVCTQDAKTVALPPSYPSSAALPAGYLVTAVETRSEGRTVLTGLSPQDFTATLLAMQQSFTTNGWTMSQGEVEKDDAESNFAGNGMQGRWAIRAIDQCPGNTSVSVVIGPLTAASTG
jgi:hypothetical protein